MVNTEKTKVKGKSLKMDRSAKILPETDPYSFDILLARGFMYWLYVKIIPKNIQLL